MVLKLIIFAFLYGSVSRSLYLKCHVFIHCVWLQNGTKQTTRGGASSTFQASWHCKTPLIRSVLGLNICHMYYRNLSIDKQWCTCRNLKQRNAIPFNKIGNLRGEKQQENNRHIKFCLGDVKQYAHMIWMMLLLLEIFSPKPSAI